jgi:hypothetical protein
MGAATAALQQHPLARSLRTLGQSAASVNRLALPASSVRSAVAVANMYMIGAMIPVQPV